MSEEGDAEDKTEAPSPRKLQKAREDGQVPLSREFSTLASLGGATLALLMLGPGSAARLSLGLEQLIENSHQLTPGAAAGQAVTLLVIAVLPFLVVPMALGAGITLLQTRFLVNAKSLAPKFSKVNPLSKAKQLFGVDNLVEFLKALGKVGVLSIAIWNVLGEDLPRMGAFIGLDAMHVFAESGQEVKHLLMSVLMAFGLLAGADVIWMNLRHYKRLKMSREDLKKESKESEGDPHIKGRRKQLQMQRSRQRMMAEVPKAQVIITNPTHYAIALRYDRDKNAAPIVVAKGLDDVAARIRELGEKSGVPLVANPPLARALYKVDLNGEVPAEQYQVIAEIIAFVMGLRPAPPPVQF